MMATATRSSGADHARTHDPSRGQPDHPLRIPHAHCSCGGDSKGDARSSPAVSQNAIRSRHPTCGRGRRMSDAANVTELHPSPAKGEGPSRNALRQRRYRKRRKSVTRNATVTPENVKPSKAVRPLAESTSRAADLLAYTVAIGLAGCAAWFSIKGMVVLFPGAPVAVVAMATAMEATKLVTAGWLASRWRATAWLWRLVLVGLVAGLAIINATGVYAQLVSAHVGERGALQSYIISQDAALAAQIEVASHAVA